MLYEYKQQLLMKCERGKEGWEVGGKRRGKGEMDKQEEKKDDPQQTSRVREGRTMGATERGRDSLSRLEKVKRGKRRSKERQATRT